MDGGVDVEKADVCALPSDGQNIQEFLQGHFVLATLLCTDNSC